VLKSLIILLGRNLAKCPRPWLQKICQLLGWGIYTFLYKRRRLLLANLHHAFPEKDHAWIERIAKKSCERTIEMGMLNLISPFLADSTLQSWFKVAPTVQATLEQMRSTQRPVLLLIPHFSLMEALTVTPLLLDADVPHTGIIYRPLKNRTLENWVKQSRERFGIQLLSRRNGFISALSILREGGVVGILFDQNSGEQGVLTTCMRRIASCTELPGMLVEKFQPMVGAFYPQRDGFLQATLHIEPLETPADSLTTVFTINNWLYNKLKTDTSLCADWLWLHDRWRTQDRYRQRFCLRAKRMGIEQTLAFNQWDALPRTTRFWLRMPNWLGDIVMALPLIRALRCSRPDAAITLLVQPHFIPLLEKFGIAEAMIALPQKKSLRYFTAFKALRKEYPDVHILLTNSLRGDLEAKCVGAPQRFGMQRPHKPRKWLTHTWQLPKDLDETKLHQTKVWEQYFRYFGLQVSIDLTPFSIQTPLPSAAIDGPSRIALFCGSENSPEKRWPIQHWQHLIRRLSAQTQCEFHLLGTAKDRAITTGIIAGCPHATVFDKAGQTSLVEVADFLPSCRLAIGNDSGGMHIANALGVPLIALYGPTNPIRTGPIFTAPHTILQPDSCSPTGGSPIEQIHPQKVVEIALHMIKN